MCDPFRVWNQLIEKSNSFRFQSLRLPCALRPAVKKPTIFEASEP